MLKLIIYIKVLLTEREVCTVKYRTEIFRVDQASAASVLKSISPIFHPTDSTIPADSTC